MAMMRRRKGCPFTSGEIETVDYKDLQTLKGFITEAGKIVPSRVTGVEPRFQRLLAQAIKRARVLALLPYCDLH